MSWTRCVVCVVVLSSCGGVVPIFAQSDPITSARHQMVDKYVASAGVKNQRVLDSMKDTPRHEFVPSDKRRFAYYDMAMPIGEGQTISPPYIVAFMTEQLDPQPTDKVLEIGTGSGYQAAVLSPLVKDVFTIEIVEPLGRRAAATLQRLRYANVHTKIGDGFAGWPEHAPFDKMIVTCSPEAVPQPLIDQLTEGGLMIVPVGERFQQTLCRFKKENGKLVRETLQATFFVPMTGQAEDERQVLPVPGQPELKHGDFEATLPDSTDPVGWYYIREGRVVNDAKAPSGERVMEFSNDVVSRNAQMLQSFGVDGREVRRIEVSLWVKAERATSGGDRSQEPRGIIEFYNHHRAPVGQATLGPWRGSFDWRQQKQTISVPVHARLAVFGIGLFGGTGQLWVDDVRLSNADSR